MGNFKHIKQIFRTTIIVLMVAYFGLITLLNIPAIQRKATLIAERELSEYLDTQIKIGNIDLGLLNRIIIQNLYVNDQDGKEMLKVARFSAKINLTSLFKGKISINSVQLFGFNAHLNKETPESKPNFQFIIDAFSSDKENKKPFNINLRINSLLIRRGMIYYDLLSAPKTPSKFNASHIGIENLSATLSLKAFTKDSLNATIKRLAFNEQSGLNLKRMKSKIVANKKYILLTDFYFSLPMSEFAIDSIEIKNNEMLDFNKIDDNTHYKGEFNASVMLSDISPLLPALKDFKENININLKADGKGQKLRVHTIDIYNNNSNINLSANGNILLDPNNIKNTHIEGKISKSNINNKGIITLYQNLTGSTETPKILNNIEYLKFTGNVSGNSNKLNTHGAITCEAGSIISNITMHKDTTTHKRSFSGHVSTESFNLGELTEKKEGWGNTIFDLEFNGFKYSNKQAASYIKGLIAEFEYKGYRYDNIVLDGQYQTGGFSGKMGMNDKNGKIELSGKFDVQQRIPVFNLEVDISNLKPYELKLTEKHKGTSISMKMKANFKGNNIDDLQGSLLIDSLNVNAENDKMDYFMDRLSIKATKEDNNNSITILSNFLNGYIKGDYSYKGMFASFNNMIAHYMPTLATYKKKKTKQRNNFKFFIQLQNSELLNKLAGIPLDIKMPSTLKGYFSDEQSKIYVNGDFPKLIYNDKLYESGVAIIENKADQLNIQLRGSTLMSKGAMLNVSAKVEVRKDTVTSSVFWGNNTNVTYSGKVNTQTTFSKGEHNDLITQIDIKPGNVILSDSIWNIHPSTISIAKDSINIENFIFEHKDQHIKADGKIGRMKGDACIVNLKNINMQYIMDMIQFHAVEFAGLASGTVHLNHVLKDPDINGRLDVKEFKLNNALLGRADIAAQYNNEKGDIVLNAKINENSSLFTNVKGLVSISRKGLDLDIDAGGTNLAFLEPFIDNIFSDIKGRVYGNIRLFGPFKQLDLKGNAKAQAELTVDVLDNRFKLQTDNVLIDEGLFQFNNVNMEDMAGNKGLANGELTHNKFKNIAYKFKFDTENMLVYNRKTETPEFPFYGQFYTTGNIILKGGNNTLNVDGTLTVGNKTLFTYVLDTASEAADNQFITFVDKTPKRIHETIETDLYHYLNKPKTEDEDDTPLDVYINFQIEPTEQASMKIIMDQAAGDNITAKGTGNLRMNFYNKGNFEMFGNYNIAEGIYKMSMQNIIRKDFKLRPGGSVSFNGNPREANLDVQAAYTVNSASLNDLIPDASTSKNNVKVNCLVNLSGKLTSPSIKFDLELPTVNDEDKELVRSLTSTEDQMNTQIIYLLGIGKFYPFNYAENTNQSNPTSSLAFNTLSGQLNNMLTQVIDNQNWNIGTNLTTGEKGWSDVEAEAILTGRLLNNRLIINGNFGYRENTLSNTNFVGDFEAIWLLTKNGEFRLRGYNQTNDRYFTKSTLTTQGIGFMYKKDFNDWKELINWMLLRKRRK